MENDHFEQLLSGYELPDVSGDLDRRVLSEGVAILERAHIRAAAEDVGHSVLHRLGFGHVAWLVDLITTTDAEYRVDLI
jgi:hypothetical protein